MICPKKAARPLWNWASATRLTEVLRPHGRMRRLTSEKRDNLSKLIHGGFCTPYQQKPLNLDLFDQPFKGSKICRTCNPRFDIVLKALCTKQSGNLKQSCARILQKSRRYCIWLMFFVGSDAMKMPLLSFPGSANKGIGMQRWKGRGSELQQYGKT